MNDYANYFDIAYKKALYIVSDTYVAKDIASEVMYLFILKKDTIPEENAIKWIMGRVKNYCKRFFASQKREKRIQEKVQNKQVIKNEISKTNELENNENVNYFYHSYLKTLKQFTEEEKSIIKVFLQNQMDIAKTAMILERPYSEIQKKIHRLKGVIRAKGYRNLGYIATKKIISPYLNESILNLLKNLNKAIENNSYQSLNHYFVNMNLKKIEFDFKIKKILDYDVRLKNDIYNVTIIFINEIGKANSLIIRFKLSSKNRLKMLDLPEKTPLYQFSSETNEAKELKEILKKYKENREGLKKIPKEVIEKYIKKYKQTHPTDKTNED